MATWPGVPTLALALLGTTTVGAEDFWSQPHAPFGGTAGVFGQINASETTTWEHTLPAGVAQGAVNHWFCVPFETTTGVVHRFYIDGEAEASVIFEPHLVSGAWPGTAGSNESPWGNAFFGKGSHEPNNAGGSRDTYYSNIRIPFGKSIRLTTTSETPQSFALHIRGAENMPVAVGDLPPLPIGARLRTLTSTAVRQPMEYHPVVNRTLPSEKTAGLLFGWLLQVSSLKPSFIECCPRLKVDRAPQFLLGSGTEDHFSASFDGSASVHSNDTSNAGRYIFPFAGMPHHFPYPDDAQPCAPHQRSAYRIFAPDPIVYSQSVEVLWRNGDTEKSNGEQGKCGIGRDDCIGASCKPVGQLGVSNVTTFAYLYEW